MGTRWQNYAVFGEISHTVPLKGLWVSVGGAKGLNFGAITGFIPEQFSSEFSFQFVFKGFIPTKTYF